MRAEQDDLRSRMRKLGMSNNEIAVEFTRRYRLRPRAAYRQAFGWTLQQAADQVNAYMARSGLDPAGRAGMTASHLCEYEQWPASSGRKPTPQVLAVLAHVYDTGVHRLLDLDDREHFTPGDLVILGKFFAPPNGTERTGRPEPLDPPSVPETGQTDSDPGFGPTPPVSHDYPFALVPVVAATTAAAAAAVVSDARAGVRGDLHGRTCQFDLSGTWWAAWQSFKGGVEVVAAQEVGFRQCGDMIQVAALARGRELRDGGYLWRGELRVWGDQILMGWYAADDGAVRSKGTMYFMLHPHGVSMVGRWVGLSYDGPIVTGWGAIAHTENDACELIDGLRAPSGKSRTTT